MPGLPDRYFVDENMLSIGKALAAVREDVVYPGHPSCPTIPRRTPDLDWLPIVGTNDWVVLMRDKRIRYRPAERKALLDHGVRAFCLTGSGNASSWSMLRLIVRHWDGIESKLLGEDGPFIFGVTGAGVGHTRLA